MPVNRKVAFLETSPEKFQQWRGDGCSSTACPTPTGNRTAAILQPPKDSSSLTETQSKSPSVDTLEEVHQRMLEKEVTINCACGLVAVEDCHCDHSGYLNGECGETVYEQLVFWNPRRDVPMK